MSIADVLLVVWVALFAASGFFRGLVSQIVSLLGVVAGALAGAWIAPHVLSAGKQSAWLPLASLAGAAIGAVVLGTAAEALAQPALRSLSMRPGLRTGDRVGGMVGGAALGLALAWLGAVLFLYQPRIGLRDAVQDSRVLPALVRFVPLDPVLRALNRFDPFPALPEFAGRALPSPDPSVVQSAGARTAAESVLKVEGTSCGLGVQGSGWVIRQELVATNAHVVSGQTDTQVLAPSGQSLDATTVYLDGGNDVALLHVPGLDATPLPTEEKASFPVSVALLGYPRDGALTASPGTAGQPRRVLAPDSYGGRVRARTVVPLRGRVQRGESGGPVVDRRGEVLAMIFGATRRGRDGFGVPVGLVLRGLDRAREPVPPGPCVG